MAKMEQTYWIKIELTKPLHLNFLMRAKKWMNGSPNEQLWPQRPTPHVNIKPTEISKIQIKKKTKQKNNNVHRTPDADICNMHTPTEKQESVEFWYKG